MTDTPHQLAAILRSPALDHGDETSLDAAYRLGRRALEEGVSVLDLALSHHAALADRLAGAPRHALRTELDRAAILFVECLSPFEMMLLGTRDINRQLVAMNSDLDDLVAERTAQLEAANLTLMHEVSERRAADENNRAQLERLNLLHRITRAIGERQDLRSIFEVAVRNVQDHLGVEFASIWLYDPVARAFTEPNTGVHGEAVALGLEISEPPQIVPDTEAFAGCMGGDQIYEPDIWTAKDSFPQLLADARVRALVASPLVADGHVFGVLVAGRRARRGFSSGECEFLRQLGDNIALAAHQAKLHEDLQKSYDELRRAQERVMQQERLRVLGQMASGIAHDINNVISPVAVYTQSLRQNEAELPPSLRAYLATVDRVIDDVAATVARMRDLYHERKSATALAPLDLNDLAQQVIDLTRARWSDLPQKRGVAIRAERDFLSPLPAINGHGTELREALINLVFNAVDAMPTGGALGISTGIVGAADGAGRVVLSVSDTGVGMDEQTRRRCLEPFFTTKGDQGTGLGLTMVAAIAQRHGAEVDIESVPGRGTTVRLAFPPATGAIMTASGPRARATARPARILLVDDVPAVRDSLRFVLELEGHSVIGADGGQAGIEAFRAAQAGEEPFDLVITDLGMPEVDGNQVARAVKTLASATPVVMLTGWGRRLHADADATAHVDLMLEKPPELQTLQDALARLLGERS